VSRCGRNVFFSSLLTNPEVVLAIEHSEAEEMFFSSLLTNPEVIHNPEVIQALECSDADETFLSSLLSNSQAGLATYRHWIKTGADAQRLVFRLLKTAASIGQVSEITRSVVAKIRQHVRNYYRTCPLSPKDVLEAASIELGKWVVAPAASSEAAACPMEKVLVAQMTLEQCCTKDEVKQVQQIYPAMSVEAMVQGMYDGKNEMKFARLVQLLRQPEYKKYRRQVKSLTSKRKFENSTDEAARKELNNLWVQRFLSFMTKP